MKRFFLILPGIFLIAGAYGCSGLGTGTGSGFQGGTEAGNPPIDTPSEVGGTEAGNPPVGDNNDGHGDGHPYEGEEPCIDGKTKSGADCTMPEDHHLDSGTLQKVHDHQDEAADADTDNQNIRINPNAIHTRPLVDFGRSDAVNGDMAVTKVPSNLYQLKKADPDPDN